MRIATLEAENAALKKGVDAAAFFFESPQSFSDEEFQGVAEQVFEARDSKPCKYTGKAPYLAEITALKSTIASLLSIDDSKVAEYVVLSPEALQAAAGNRVAELEAKVARHEAPVTVEDLHACLDTKQRVFGPESVQAWFDALIAHRSNPPAKEQK